MKRDDCATSPQNACEGGKKKRSKLPEVVEDPTHKGSFFHYWKQAQVPPFSGGELTGW